MRRTVGLLASVAILSSALLGAPAANAAAGDLVAGGSSFAGSIIKACATNFAGVDSSFSITYTSNSSQTGKDNFRLGTYNFGGTDFAYTGTNGDVLPTGAKYVPVTAGPIAVVYNLPTVTNLKLTPQVIAKIYKGTITTWNHADILALQVSTVKTALLRLTSKTITPIYRSTGSGTSDNFSGYLAATTNNFTQSSDWSVATGGGTPRGNSASSSGTMKTTVVATAGSIGYLDLKDSNDAANPTKIKSALLRNEAGQYYAPDAKRSATFLNAQATSAVKADGSVALDWTKSISGGYNATLITFAVVNTTGAKTVKGAAVKKFITYLLNVCGPAVSYGLGFTPITGTLRTKAGAVIQLIK
jgi:phosphate transport system substrate-binding protein